MPPLAWGWPQPSHGLEDSTHGNGTVAVLHELGQVLLRVVEVTPSLIIL